ncbi:MAG: hypothetical protein QOE15_592 [Acidimicrobiaceae bacterium]|nr:hypothetical protein [Acidimicrobiaceae bacterium]
MTDPMEDRLRRAMHSGAAQLPVARAETMRATRVALAGRIRRRQHQAMSLAAALVLLVTAGTVAFATGRSGGSTSRQVAAGGGNRSDPTTSPSTSTPVDGGSIVAVIPGSSTSIAEVTSTPGGHSTVRSTVPPKVTTVPTTLPSTVSSTSPPTTTSSTTPTPATSSQVRGTVLFSPTCPVEQNPPLPACAPRPGPAHVQLVRTNGTVAAQGNAGADGTFAIPVAPGSYNVVVQTVSPSTAPGRGCSANPANVTVTPGSATTVAVSCDTGIR